MCYSAEMIADFIFWQTISKVDSVEIISDFADSRISRKKKANFRKI